MLHKNLFTEDVCPHSNENPPRERNGSEAEIFQGFASRSAFSLNLFSSLHSLVCNNE